MTIYLILSNIIFIIGSFGIFFFRRHIILLLICLELLFLAVDLNFVIASVFLDDLLGQIYCLFLLTMIAAESALGLAILVVYYRLRGGISVDLISLLKS
jgi:NADH-quinone oxidoreductase subunit K